MMWNYFGGKFKLAKEYPVPRYDLIIEPFSGTAQYSLRYYDRNIILIDKYLEIIKLWKWLQSCSKKDILSLPHIELDKTLDDYSWDCEESRTLVGFLISAGDGRPRNKPSLWRAKDHPRSQETKKIEIANSLYKIKHWELICGEYNCIDNVEATWFIDPPYQSSGYQYKYGSKLIDYNILGKWCKERSGQVIVCENDKANWLEFNDLTHLYGIKYKTKERLWYKE
jgi:hypothetical protein